MDFGLLALIVVGANKLLSYVAPRTHTKVDDKIRDGFQWALGLLPFVNKQLGDAVDKAESEPAVVVARKADGPVVRDHR